MNERLVPGAERSGPGSGFVGMAGVVIFTGFLLLGAILTLVHLYVFWPAPVEGAPAPGELAERRTVSYFGFTELTLSTEILFFIIVGLAGALGGLIHAVRSLGRYVGARQLRWSWVPFYCLLPLVGVLGGTVFYLILRAGLFSPSTSVEQASPFGFAAVAALVGLFSEQAMEKLREVAGDIFTRSQPLTDQLEADPPDPARRVAG